MPDASYYIIARKNEALLSFLNIGVIVNNKKIYPLLTMEPVIIPVKEDHLSIVITDGFHFTRPLNLTYDQPGYFNFEVDCIVDDQQLLGGSLLLVICYLLAIFTGFLVFKLLSFTPILYFLFFLLHQAKKISAVEASLRQISLSLLIRLISK